MLELMSVAHVDRTNQPSNNTKIAPPQVEQIVAESSPVASPTPPIAPPETVSFWTENSGDPTPQVNSDSQPVGQPASDQPSVSEQAIENSLATKPSTTKPVSPLKTTPKTSAIATQVSPESDAITIPVPPPDNQLVQTLPVQSASTIAPSVANGGQTEQDDRATEIAVRKRDLERKLAEIVARDRQQQAATIQKKLTVSALKFAESGQFQRAKAIARDTNLKPATQATLLAKINGLERQQVAAAGTSGTVTPLSINSLNTLPYDVEVLAILRAIVVRESSGNYRAVNPHSGALGLAQIMPANLRSWSREALGREVSRSEFLNSPMLQIQIIAFRLNKYWQSALASSDGNEAIAVRKVASLWYSGKANLFNSYTPQFYRGYRYPSIAEYTLKVLERYLQEKQSIVAANYGNETGGQW
ncbi:MAG: transglycosylase SLT domain-containing protein [Scytolyngbya sp. HA4215-MV1]|jgi:hypothetical protein|nr:transglycosylase SLT domain-containing protein [Scytolyngbya sp. HA4215-MV1]